MEPLIRRPGQCEILPELGFFGEATQHFRDLIDPNTWLEREKEAKDSM